jgi:hypothetical protein
MAMEFVLGASGAYVNYDSLLALDAAFDAACRWHPVGVQITAETYRKISGQGIGRTHAHRLNDGRVFRRSLASWQEAELEQLADWLTRVNKPSRPGNKEQGEMRMTYILMVVLLSAGTATSATTAEFNTLDACNDAGSKLYFRVTEYKKDRNDVIWICEPKGRS